MTADNGRSAQRAAADVHKGEGRRLPGRGALAASTALILLAAGNPVSGQTTWTGAVDDDWDTAGNWSTGVVPTAADTVVVDSTSPFPVIGAGVTATASHVIVGQSMPGANAIYIVGGGTLTSATANGNLLGFNAGSHGEILVSGAGSQWTASGPIFVGVGGEGVVFVTNGGVINGTSAVLGFSAGSEGLVSMAGAGTQWINTGVFAVGVNGNGRVLIGSGAYLESTGGFIGGEAGGYGEVTVSGAAQWVNNSTLTIGFEGTGALDVTSGGVVDSQNTAIAAQAGAVGSATIAGAGSQLNATNLLLVGDAGSGTLRVEDNGSVMSGGHSFIGTLAGSAGEMFLDNATMTVGGDLVVGLLGAGSLSAGAGSTVTVAGTASVADQAGSTGMLTVDGNLTATMIDIGQAGRLGGSGTITGQTNVSGTVAPGSSIGTLSIIGNYTQAAGSTYEVEGNAAGQSDRLSVTGAATLNGGKVVFTPFPDYAVGTPYTVLTAAGGVTGAFDEATFGSSLFLGVTLAYDPNNVFLTIAQTASFASAGATPNQIAAASGADSLGPGNAIWDAIVALGSQAQAQAAFDSLSGEVHVSAKTTLADDSRLLRDAAMKRIRDAFGDTAAGPPPLLAYGEDAAPPPVPADPDRFTFWAQGVGAWAARESDGNAARLSGSTGGVFMGGDAGIGNDWRLGVIAGYNHAAFSVADRASSGTSDNFHLGVYGGTRGGRHRRAFRRRVFVA